MNSIPNKIPPYPVNNKGLVGKMCWKFSHQSRNAPIHLAIAPFTMHYMCIKLTRVKEKWLTTSAAPCMRFSSHTINHYTVPKLGGSSHFRFEFHHSTSLYTSRAMSPKLTHPRAHNFLFHSLQNAQHKKCILVHIISWTSSLLTHNIGYS